MKELLPMIIREEEGQGMVEYGLIIAGVALAAMAAIWLLGPQVSALFTELTTQLAA
ncbi:Flp family type IVb pilin [Eubacteriaceae bacterium ES3]|nr:Flp family type IVb pilin [Eubacteriaceae bacterium ES3]WKY48735.1 Flp family type IVb pilin [Eubacteriaceae bacterium ES3]